MKVVRKLFERPLHLFSHGGSHCSPAHGPSCMVDCPPRGREHLAFSFSFRGLFGVPLCCSRPSGTRLVWRSPPVHVAGPLCRSPCPAALWPLGLASLPRRWSSTPAEPGGFVHPRGALPSSRRGWAAAARDGTLCASAGRWGKPTDAPQGPRFKTGGRPTLTSWVSTSAGLLLSPVAARLCVCGSVSVVFFSDELVPS
jgi:hypothetical protein